MNFVPFYISPEIILTAGGILVLLAGLSVRKWAVPGKIRPYSPEVITLAVLVAALVSSIMLLTRVGSHGVSQFGGMIAVDHLSIFFKIIALASTIIVVFLAMDYFRGVRIHRGEFYALLIFAVLAINFLAAATDLVMIYLSLEFLSITSYILVGFLKQDRKSNEAAIKYFLYGAVAAAVMVYGMSMFYGMSAVTSLAGIHQFLVLSTPGGLPHTVFLGLLLMLVGFGFKVAMVPFHQWAPDTYEGAPTPVTAFLSVGSKAAGFAVLIRVLGSSVTPDTLNWVPLMAILSGLTMTVGNLTAIPQVNIKRMLAYSSIGQAGYLLLGIAAMRYSALALPSVLLYLFVYLFMNLGAFAVVTIVSARLNSDDIRDYGGLVRRAPMTAVAMVFFLLSLAGIPPTAGFVAKFYLFSAAIQSNNTTIVWLAVVAIANTVASVYYYMNVVRHMFFAKPKSEKPLQISWAMNFVVGITLAITLLGLLYPQPFIDLAHRSASMLTGT
jgi:NADH-quinone oxidoreductase subunit N